MSIEAIVIVALVACGLGLAGLCTLLDFGHSKMPVRSSKFANELDRLIALGDRLRAEWHEADCETKAVGIGDRMDATADSLVLLHGYHPVHDKWLASHLRRVVTHGDDYDMALARVMASKRLAHQA